MEVLAKYQDLFERNKVCVLIPTYNNAATLQSVINGVYEITINVIVVNDGSTDNTIEILSTFNSLTVVSYEKNKGKGVALRTGFKKAVEKGFDYAITIDSDGQHFPSELPLFVERLEKDGPALIIGSRNMGQASVPGKSSFGHKFSNFWFWIETGIKAPDTQSGYRLYPVKLLEKTKYITRKFEFEIEVIVRAAWNGIKIESVPVKVYYAPPGERVSHFRPFKDFTRISILNTFLVLITFLYIYPRNFIRAIFKKETYLNLKKELYNENETTLVSAISIGFGVFMGIVPIWGFQLLTAITLSVLFKLNKALVILSANVSLPPIIPFVIYLSYKVGGLWVTNSTPISFSKNLTLDSIHENFIQYMLGGFTLALGCGLIAGLISWIGITIYKRRKTTLTNE